MSDEIKIRAAATEGCAAVTGSAAMWSDIECDDERHMAIALYLLQKAIAIRETNGSGFPTIHACLRDAAAHCDAARQHWTIDAVARRDLIARQLFPQSDERSRAERVG